MISLLLITSLLLIPLPLVAEPLILTDNEMLEMKIRNSILPLLAQCESGRQGMSAWNDNDGGIGKHSIGKYQWQLPSWLYWTNYYGLKNYDIISENDQDDLTL